MNIHILNWLADIADRAVEPRHTGYNRQVTSSCLELLQSYFYFTPSAGAATLGLARNADHA